MIQKREQTENGIANGYENKGEREKTCTQMETPRNLADDDRKMALECRDSLESDKMAASSASEGDSAMSQVHKDNFFNCGQSQFERGGAVVVLEALTGLGGG